MEQYFGPATSPLAAGESADPCDRTRFRHRPGRDARRASIVVTHRHLDQRRSDPDVMELVLGELRKNQDCGDPWREERFRI